MSSSLGLTSSLTATNMSRDDVAELSLSGVTNGSLATVASDKHLSKSPILRGESRADTLGTGVQVHVG